jgi:hypothetical protein
MYNTMGTFQGIPMSRLILDCKMQVLSSFLIVSVLFCRPSNSPAEGDEEGGEAGRGREDHLPHPRQPHPHRGVEEGRRDHRLLLDPDPDPEEEPEDPAGAGGGHRSLRLQGGQRLRQRRGQGRPHHHR